MTAVTVRHLVAAHRIADVLVTLDDGTRHRVGYHPADAAWWCHTCDTSRSCAAVDAARAVCIELDTPPATNTAGRG